MKRIYITLTRRVPNEGDSPEDRGELVVVDWDKKQKIGTYSMASGEDVETGRSRGVGGITWHDDKLYLGCRKGILSVNPDTYEGITSVKMGEPLGIHQIKSDGDVIWATCLKADCLQVIRDDKVEVIFPTTEFGTIPRPSYGETSQIYNGLNAIGFAPDGEMFVLYSHQGCIYSWTQKRRVVEGLMHGPHDICFINEDECLFTQSSSKEMFKANVRTGNKTLVFSRQNVSGGQPHAATGWLRGIEYYESTNSVFLAAAPGTLMELDATSWKCRDSYVFNEVPNEAPFDILLDPRDWKEGK